MCAENFSDRLYKDLARGPVRSAHSVGRVGALAVALGIGGAILGLSPVAAADAGDAAGPGQESGRSTDAGPRRGGSAAPSNAEKPNAEATTNNSRPSRAARTARGSSSSGADPVVTPTLDRNAEAPALAVSQAPAAAVDSAPSVTADEAPVVVAELAPAAVAPVVGDESAGEGAGVSADPVRAVIAPAEVAVVADGAPVMTAAASDALAEGDVDPAALLGEGGTGEPGAEPLAWAALAATRREDLAGPTPEVAPAAAETTGEPVEPLAAAAVEVAAATFTLPPYPSNPACGTTVCSLGLKNARASLINQIADAVAAAFPDQAGTPGGCGSGTCPVSPANYVGAYAYNVIYALMSANFSGNINAAYDAQVGTTVQQLFSQPQILTFVSEVVAAKFSKLPPALATTIGNAAGTFLINSFGNTTVANALVPFLRGLNIPYNNAPATAFALAAQNNGVFAAILSSGTGSNARQINPQSMLTGLTGFFANPSVQSQLGAAVTAAVNVLLGLNTQPSWVGEPTVGPTALSDYVGQMFADKLLAEDNPNNPALAATIGGAVQTLFANVGGVVATQAGTALQAFLNAPGQNVAGILSTAVVNGLVVYLQEGAKQQPNPPFPGQPPLGPSLGPAAGYAVTGFVNAVLSDPAVTGGLGQFLTQVVPGILGNQGIQDEINATVSNLVATLVGGNLGAVVGPQVGAAVLGLVTDPTVITALTTFVNTAVGNFLSSPGVVGQLADAAGALAAAQLEGTLAEQLPQIEADLRASTDIQDGANIGVTLAVQGLLSNTGLWVAIDSAVTSLVGTLLGDTEVQAALAKDVAALVEKRIPGPIGAFLGAQVGAVAVSLATNPVVQAGVKGVVDTLFTDFWGSPGVIVSFSEAAGELAAAAVAGTLATVAPAVAAQLQADPAVQAGVEIALGAAMTEFLGDSALWAAVDQTLSAAVISLTTDPVVLAALDKSVTATVEVLLGEPLGSVVGPQVGAAVVSLVSNPVVVNSLLGVVDTLFSDFFSAPGVVDAFSAAASQWGLVLLTTLNLSAATKAARDELKASPAVENGVGVSVTAAVAEFLGNKQLWSVVDQTVSSLVATLLGDAAVQQALGQQVSAMVAAKIGGPLGPVVGDAVGAAVVSLVTNPIIESAVHGLVDTLFGDFWGYPGVVTAFSEAAGTLATAALVGDLDVVAPQVQAALRANPSVQGAAELAAGDAVTELLSNTAVWTTVDATLSSLVSGLISDPAVQAALYQTVSSTVETLVGGPLGAVVGPQVATAVVSLVTNPVVGAALHGLVDTLFSDFFGAYGVIPAFAGAASELALVLVTGGDLSEAVKAAQQELKNSPAIENGVDVSVTAAVAELLGDTQLWAVVDQTVSSLVVTILGDQLVQDALGQQVSALVAAKIPGPLGVVVGDAVGAAVVSLVTDPVIQSALGAVVDTLFTDFWGSPGVVTAFSEAAGTLAVAALVGDLDVVAPQVQAALRANPDVDAAVQLAVGDAVVELLSDTAVWATVDSTLSSLVSGLINNPEVEQALYQTVSSTVALLVGEPLGAVVGPQVATAVVSLVTNPVVGTALHGVVDTLFSDFFGAPGVVDAFGNAAGEFAEILVTGGSLAEAETAARQELRASTAVQNGVDVSVTAAVAELLGDTQLWAVVDQTVSSLAVTLLGDQMVQDALAAQVAAAVEKQIKGPLGPVVGEAVGAAVVSLVTNPAIQAGLGAVIDTLFTDFWGSPGVVTAFSEAAGTLALAALTGDLATVAPEVRAALQANPDVQTGVDVSVTAAVAELLSDTAVWAALDSTLSSLVTGLLNNPDVDQALYQTVSTTVALLVGGPLGAVVGPQVATAVVSLVTNPDIQAGLLGVVDTLFSDFFGAPGVIDAFAGAAGDIALVAFTGGDISAAIETAKQELRANADVDAGVEVAVSGAVAELLGDRALWLALDSTLSSLAVTLLGDPLVQQAVSDQVAAMVAAKIGGPLGPIVGAQVGTAVVSLLTNPAIQSGVGALVDTLFSDFFGAPGVIDAFAGAAGDLALVAFTGGDLSAALKEVEQALRTGPDIDAAVYQAVSAGVSQLLSDTAVWAAVDSTLSTLVAGLVNDPVIEQALYQTVSSAVAALVGGPLGAAVGPQVATAVVALVTNPAIAGGLHQLVDTLFSDFIGAPGVISVLSDAAGTLASAAVYGNLDTVQPMVVQEVRTNPDIDAAVYEAVNAGASQLLSDTAVWTSLDTIFSSLIGGLISDPVVQQSLTTQISATVTALVGGPLGAVVGPQVATAVVSLITDPAIGVALNQLVDTLFFDFFSAPGVISTLSDAAGTLASAAVYGNLSTVLPEVTAAVRMSPDIDAGVFGAVSTAFTQFFGNADVAQAVGSTVTTLATNLLGDTVVQQSAGAAVAALVTGFIGDSPIAEPVGQAVGAAVSQFLATPGVAAALGVIIGSVTPDFLSQPGTPAGLGNALGDLAVALVRGDDLTEATQIALDDLKSNEQIVAALEATIADALNLVDTTILSDPTIQQSLGAITTELIATLADDPQIQAYVAEEYGAPVAALLTNQAVVNEIATQLGLAVTELLAYPGVSTAITDSLNLFADEYIGGTDEFVALGDALRYLQADPAFIAGVNAVIPNTVNTILADPAVLEAVGVLVKEEAIAALASFGIKNKFIGRVVGQVAEGTTLSFLTRPVGLGVVDDLVVKLVLGMPLSEVTSYLGNEVVYSAKVRWALGFSVGQGIGSLFGDNIVGRLIGVVAGVPVTVTLGITTAIERFYEWLSSGWAVAPDVSPGQTAPAASALPNGSRFFQPVPAATDQYVMNAVLLDRQQAAAAREALDGDGRFTLTGMTVNEPDAEQSASLDITMALEAADHQDGENPLALLAFRFPLDRIIPAPEPATFPAATAATAERVS